MFVGVSVFVGVGVGVTGLVGVFVGVCGICRCRGRNSSDGGSSRLGCCIGRCLSRCLGYCWSWRRGLCCCRSGCRRFCW